jgi:osmoprotectant transport system permease protein
VTWAEVQSQLHLLPNYLGNHMLLSMAALGIGLIICLPLSIVITRVKPLQWPTLAFASIMQTIPGIALLALMVPLLSMIGFVPALIALVLYSMLPILRNGVTGILGVDPTLIEAARGIGMSPRQQLIRVELPLALPVLIAGIRTSTVWVVGTATLATPVGAISLGNFIFGGLQTQNTTAVLVGCIAAALLAITLDQLIRLLESAAVRRSRRRAGFAIAGLVVLLGLGLMPLIADTAPSARGPKVIIGAKTFTEQFILAELLTDLLRERGFEVELKSSLGSVVLFEAVAAGAVDCYVDYSGTIWNNAMKQTEVRPADTVLVQMTAWLRENRGVIALGRIGFENAYALAIRQKTADSLKVTSIGELSPFTPVLNLGSDYEFFARPEWSALKSSYGLRFREERAFDPSLMYAAIREGQVDCITAYSTDGRIISEHLAVLDDPRQVLPPYDAVLLLSENAAGRADLVAALEPLLGAITDQQMREANRMVDIDHRPVAEAARYLRQFVH